MNRLTVLLVAFATLVGGMRPSPMAHSRFLDPFNVEEFDRLVALALKAEGDR